MRFHTTQVSVCQSIAGAFAALPSIGLECTLVHSQHLEVDLESVGRATLVGIDRRLRRQGAYACPFLQ